MTSGLSAIELHVKDFGAVGDGVHDDGLALRQVFTEASKAGELSTVNGSAHREFQVPKTCLAFLYTIRYHF